MGNSSSSDRNISAGKSLAEARAESPLAKTIEQLQKQLNALSGASIVEQQQQVNSLKEQLRALADPKLLALKEEARKLAAEIADSESEKQERELREQIRELQQKKRQRSVEKDSDFQKLRDHINQLKAEIAGSEEEQELKKLSEEIKSLNQQKRMRNFEDSPAFAKLQEQRDRLKKEIEGSEEEQEQRKLEEEIEQLQQEKAERNAELNPRTAARKQQLKKLQAERTKLQQATMYRALEDEIADLKEEIDALGDESARDDEQWERRQERQKGKLDGGFSRSLDVEQAFNFNRTRQVAFGYVTALTIGRVPLMADFTESDPSIAMGTTSGTVSMQTAPNLKVVGAIESVSWELGTEDPIEFSIRISAMNKQKVMGVQYSTAAAVDVVVGFKVYEYDQAAFMYYIAFASSQSGTPIQGQIKKSRGDSGLKLSVGFEPASEVWAPANFALSFTIRPKTLMPQQLYLGTSITGRLIKPWG